MDIKQMLMNYELDTVIIAVITVILTGIMKMPIKKLAAKSTYSVKITRFLTFLPILIGFGLTCSNSYGKG